MNSEKVAILLSTFNGEKYLQEQITSILDQSHHDFILYIRDDGSTDLTIEILEEYSKETEKIVLLRDSSGNIGVAKSYQRLMKFANSDYYLFADQDDLWEKGKVETLLKTADNSDNKNKPYLLFSNMTVFYENSSESYDFFRKFKVNKTKLKNGLFQGIVSGCLMLFNDEAKKMSFSLNSNSNMLHDWDLLMTSYLYGSIELTDKHLIKHRLHSTNVIGEQSKKSVTVLLKDFAKYIFKSADYRKIALKDYFDYTESCVNNIDHDLRISKELFIEVELNKLAYLKRKKWYLKHFNPFIYGNTRGLLILFTV